MHATIIGLDLACGSAHHWARVFTAVGHEVRLMHAKYVKAYVKRGKSDVRDARIHELHTAVASAKTLLAKRGSSIHDSYCFAALAMTA